MPSVGVGSSYNVNPGMESFAIVEEEELAGSSDGEDDSDHSKSVASKKVAKRAKPADERGNSPGADSMRSG